MRKIRLKYNYGGAPSKERRILAGTYDENDPALCGLAGYLVGNDHAEYVEVESELMPESDKAKTPDEEPPPIVEEEAEVVGKRRPRTRKK